MFNIVFVIGAGIILGDSDSAGSSVSAQSTLPVKRDPTFPSIKRQKLSTRQDQPEEYHSSPIVHLESFLGSSSPADRPDGFGGGLEELQAVLLLAGFALLRPAAPGLWYIIGVAVRLAVDLGLHYKEGTWIEGKGDGLDPITGASVVMEDAADGQGDYGIIGAKERGRREWVRDLRRRL
ncbi:MAG: Fungal specific transcription factor [Pleopsidium flavum]|nr:MAG: Fungal specific transcription factor [Pleopsidium flavum]